jgi:hypothetical protein
MREVHIQNTPGTVILYSQAKGYYSRFFKDSGSFSEIEPLNLPYEVKDSYRLEVVWNVDVQPKYRS